MFIQINNPKRMQRFQVDKFDEIFLLAGSIPFFNWTDTSFENQLLYWFCLNFFAALVTLILRGWNLFLRLCGIITISQLIPEHDFLTIIWIFKYIHDYQGVLLFRLAFFVISRYGNIISSKIDLSVFFVKLTEKESGNSNFSRQHQDFS